MDEGCLLDAECALRSVAGHFHAEDPAEWSFVSHCIKPRDGSLECIHAQLVTSIDQVVNINHEYQNAVAVDLDKTAGLITYWSR